jgi:hypothetical protein
VPKNLKELFEERSGAPSFKKRNAAYKLFENCYNSDTKEGLSLDLTYRPNNVDGVSMGYDNELNKIAVNQVRRVVSHFGSMFSHRPRVYVIPFDVGSAKMADAKADYIEHVMKTSNMDALHAQQSHFLALRGDAVFGVDWNPTEGTRPRVTVKVYDPRHCYPLFTPFDLGGVEDMLIAARVNPQWARAAFDLPSGVIDPGKQADLFYYWTATELQVQIEEYNISKAGRSHGLGFCPFRWVFGDPSGLMAQADCREVPKLQEVFNEALLLTLDAVRKQVDPAWYVTGVPKDVTPEPGVANALPEGASVGRWPIEANPNIIMQVMSSLEEAIYTTTGVSPISMQGIGRGSDRSGAAIRHQVEAVDARTEQRKVLLEAAYAKLGEMVLKVTAQNYPQEMMIYAPRDEKAQGFQQKSGRELGDANPLCGALYSDFVSQTPETRFQIALQGLGRLFDEKYAIGNVLNLPGTDPEQMSARLREYQIKQAKIVAEAQSAAQQIVQQAQEEDQQAGGMPPGAGNTIQPPQRPQPPSGKALRDQLAVITGQANGRGQGRGR